MRPDRYSPARVDCARAGAARGAAVLLALGGAAASASASVCAPAPDDEFMHLGATRLAHVAVAGPNVRAVEARESALRARLWRSADRARRQSLRLVHDYRALEIEAPSPPLTNGDLHRLGLEWRMETPAWEAGAAALLASSSNAGQHPHVIDADLAAWHGTVRYKRELSPSVTAFLGICRDDRGGRRAVTPVAGLRFEPGAAWSLLLGWPDARLALRPHAGVELALGIHPAGGEWRVLDDELERRSRFTQRAWRLEAEVAVTLPGGQRLALGGGIERRRRLTFETAAGGVASSLPGARYAGIRWQWRR